MPASSLDFWTRTPAQPSDRANPTSAARIGKLLGVDAIIVGSITQFGQETKNTKVGGNAGNDQGTLNPTAYKAEVAALRSKLGQSMEGSPQYAALQARRLAWRG